MKLNLSTKDEAMLNGDFGDACQMAMRILTTMTHVYGASELLDIYSAHIDGCIYHGPAGFDFAQRLLDGGAKTCVPTTLNVGGIDLIHPENYQGNDVDFAQKSARQMEMYKEMGCRPIFTCAPYQVSQRPALGMQIAWAESNAIVFANSVLGARTNRYGDFIDICAAITGRAPKTGLHLTENRRGQILFRLGNVPDQLLAEDVFYPVLGYYIGYVTSTEYGSRTPVIEGLPAETTEDQLKALGAAAASGGAVALFHAVGVTPEAPTLADALHHQAAGATIDVSMDDLIACRQKLSTVPDGNIDVVAFGSPHFSLDEFAQLVPLLQEDKPALGVDMIVCTNRFVLDRLTEHGWDVILREAGVRVVVDTCVVVTPIVKISEGVLMTNSGKFAHYTPGNTGLQVIYGSMKECVRSASLGRVWRDDGLWG
ncbi:MAG: aconitase X catalytic domain-containing protein [Pseudomonadota bacterium]